MATSDSQINKPHRGRPKRAELPDVNINTVAQNINTKSASLIYILTRLMIITNSSNLRVTPHPHFPEESTSIINFSSVAACTQWEVISFLFFLLTGMN